MTTFTTIAAVTVAGKEVKGFVIPAPVVVAQDLGKFFDMDSRTITNIVITQVGRIYVVSGVNHKVFMVEEGTEFDSMKNFRTFQFLCHARLQNSAIAIGMAGKIDILELQGMVDAEAEEADTEAVVEEAPITEAPVEKALIEEAPMEKAPVEEAKKEEVRQYKTIQSGTIVKKGLGEMFFGVPSKMIHEVKIEAVNKEITAVYVSLVKDAVIEGFSGTFNAETANAIMAFAKTGNVPANFVSPEMLVVTPAVNETLAAEENKNTKTNNSEESVLTMTNTQTMTTKKVANEVKGFTTLLQTGDAFIRSSKALRLKAADKSPQVLSLQGSVAYLQAFVTDNNGNIVQPVDMVSVFNPEEAANLQAAGQLKGANADSYKMMRNVAYRHLDGTVTYEQVPTFTDNIIFVATEHNLPEFMKIKETETAFILSNESAQSRIASQGKLANFETHTAQGEVARMQVQDASNLAVMDFKSPAGMEMPELLMNHLFYANGVFFRTRKAPVNVMELKGLNQLVQYTTSNDTPSQKRQAKVSFIANTETFDVYDFLKGMGNELRGYIKKQTQVMVNGAPVQMYQFDVQKNSSRLGLLGSASKELKAFNSKLGKLVERKVIADDVEEFTTTTGLRILLAPDVSGNTKQAAKVFNSDIYKTAPGNKDAKPSIMTSKDFNWIVNLTDGGIVSDASFMEPMLREEKLVARVRNGRMRGFAHQFRMNFQVKGLNVVAPGVKELTGYDMILFDGARKTDLLALLEEGRELTYHVMLTAATFKEDSTAGISAQAMNNLNIDPEISTMVANENIAKAEAGLLDIEKREESFAMMKEGKDMADMESCRNVLSKSFGIQKFAETNPIVWKDVYAKLEIQAEIIDFIKTHKGGYLHVNAKNNYMFTDLYAILKAVGDMTFFVKEENLAAQEGEVVLPMMTKEGQRYFFQGDIMSIRSPHVVNDETQFATAVNPLNSDNAELVKFWTEWLAGGYVDGITFFSAVDIMVPASSGADFDGDTSLIIVDGRIIDGVKRTPQYVNFHTLTDDSKPAGDTSAWAYEFGANGILVGGWLKDGKLATAMQKEEAEKEGLMLEFSKDSNILLGEGCPWKDPAPAPAFDLPEGMFQDNFNIYIPADMIDTPEAYKAWVDAIHKVIGNSISASDIGSMSNIVMAITNGINFVELQIEKMVAEGRMDEAGRLNIELKYLTDMREVFVPVVWFSIDSAKHGGAYKEILKDWMAWTSGKGMKKEMESGSVKSMKRVLGYAPKTFDVRTREITEAKRAIILPNVIREAKFQFGSKKGAMATNLQKYATAMSTVLKDAEANRNKIPAIGNNLLDVTYSILNSGVDFNAGLAKKIYAYFADQFESQSKDLDAQLRHMRNVTEERLAERALNFRDMNNAKQTAWVKRFFPNYQAVRTQQQQLISTIRQQLRMTLIKHDMDVVKFAAVAYNFAYETAMDLEKRNAKANAKAPIYALWKLLSEDMVYMLASIEGARIAPAKSQNIIFGISSLYFIPTEAFKASAKTIDMTGKELALTGSQKGMNVYLVDKGQDAVAGDLIGECSGVASYKFVQAFSYRVSNPRITNINTTGMTMDLGTVYCYGNMIEGVTPKSARAQWDRTATAKSKFPVALYGKATMEDLEIKVGTQFVAINSNGTTFFGVEVDGKIKPVAKALAPVQLQEGDIYNLDAEFSAISGQLTVYVYRATKK